MKEIPRCGSRATLHSRSQAETGPRRVRLAAMQANSYASGRRFRPVEMLTIARIAAKPANSEAKPAYVAWCATSNTTPSTASP